MKKASAPKKWNQSKEIPLIAKKNLDALEKTIRSCKKIAIFSHDDPDPDAIISCILLKKITEHFGVKAKIFYKGSISRVENKTMFNKLNIAFESSDKENFDNFDGLATADCQASMNNVNFPKNRQATISIDHHPIMPEKAEHSIIMPKFGATATIVMHYYLSYGLPISEKIASGYVYALQSETKNFARDAIKLDMDIYKMVLVNCDLKEVSQIQSTKKPVEYYKVLSKALREYRLHNGIIRADLESIKDLAYVHEITEVLSQIQGVSISVVAGKKGTLGRICARSESTDLDIGKTMKDAMRNISEKNANGGGHPQMSAGNFRCKSKEALNFFYKELKKN